jgi:hypothetical protein
MRCPKGDALQRGLSKFPPVATYDCLSPFRIAKIPKMELFGDLSSYNAAATLRVSSIVKSLDEVLYRMIESDCVSLSTDSVDDERARSIRNPLLLMFRRAYNFLTLTSVVSALAAPRRPLTFIFDSLSDPPAKLS